MDVIVVVVAVAAAAAAAVVVVVGVRQLTRSQLIQHIRGSLC